MEVIVVVGYEICAVSTSSGQGENEAAAGEDAEGCAAVVASQGRSLAFAWKGGRGNFFTFVLRKVTCIFDTGFATCCPPA